MISQAFRKYFNSVLLILIVFGSSPAHSNEVLLEEVIVTAQKREQDVKDVPISISVFSSGDIKNLISSDLKSLQYYTPNLTIADNSKVGPRIGIRGVSDFSRNPGYDNRVGVYLDGAYVGRSAVANQETFDIESIEVLRGPQGTLFGKNTVAGVINLVSIQPSEEFYGKLGLNVGNEGLYSSSVTLNGTLLKSQLQGKLAINNTRRDGYIKHLPSSKQLNDEDMLSGRIQLLWEHERGAVNFSFDSQRDSNTGTDAEKINDVSAPGPYSVSTDYISQQYIRSRGVALSFEQELSHDFTLTSINSLREEVYFAGLDEDYSLLDIARSSIDGRSQYFSTELRLASPVGKQFEYLIAFFGFWQENASQSNAQGGVLFPTYNKLSNPFPYVEVPATVNVDSYAIYSHGSYKVGPQLSVSAGLRYTVEGKELDYEIKDTTGLFLNAAFHDSRRSENLSPRISLTYAVNDQHNIYAGYSRGFKSGGWNVDFVNSLDQLSFGDEEVTAYEVGSKSEFFDGRLRINLSIYDSEYHDFQVFQFSTLPNNTTVLSIRNAASVSARGAEFESYFAINGSLYLISSLAYSDSAFDSFKNGGGIGVDYDGYDTPDAPATSFSTNLRYSKQLVGGLDLIANINYSFRDSFFSHPDNSEMNRINSYSLFDASVELESSIENWSISIWGKNLLNTDKMTERSVSFLGVGRAAYLKPRSFGVSFEYQFGNEF